MTHYESRILRPDPRTNYAAELRILAFAHVLFRLKSGCRPIPIHAGMSPWFRNLVKIVNEDLREREASVRAIREQELVDVGCDISDPRAQDILDKIMAQENVAWRVFDSDLKHYCAAPILENGSYDRQFCNRVIYARRLAFLREGKKISDILAWLNDGARSQSQCVDRHCLKRASDAYFEVAQKGAAHFGRQAVLELCKLWQVKEAAHMDVSLELYLAHDQTLAAGVHYLLEDARRQKQFEGLKGERLAAAIIRRYDVSDLVLRASAMARGKDMDAPLFDPRSRWSAA